MMALGPSSIKTIARHTGMGHSAVSQTVAKMVAESLIVTDEGKDGRERIARPTKLLTGMIPELEAQWLATNRAAASLDNELSLPLSQIAAEAIEALRRKSFSERIALQQDDKRRP
ncbi:MAG: MarR family transcriptional regulator [Burkholderiales bacterium]